MNRSCCIHRNRFVYIDIWIDRKIRPTYSWYNNNIFEGLCARRCRPVFICFGARTLLASERYVTWTINTITNKKSRAEQTSTSRNLNMQLLWWKPKQNILTSGGGRGGCWGHGDRILLLSPIIWYIWASLTHTKYTGISAMPKSDIYFIVYPLCFTITKFSQSEQSQRVFKNMAARMRYNIFIS